MSQAVVLPTDLPPGRYSLLLGIGSPKVPGTSYQYIPITADVRFGIADGRMRYKVADVTVERGPSSPRIAPR